jgi:hypothetical protein
MAYTARSLIICAVVGETSDIREVFEMLLAGPSINKISNVLSYPRVRLSIVAKALCYKPEGPGFETR